MRVPLAVQRASMRWLVRPVYGPPLPVAAQRRLGDLMGRVQPHPRGVTASDVRLGGRPARRYVPAGARTDAAVLWLHGGAFMTGSDRTHGSFAAHLAREVGAPVYLLDYRLAPEHPHPAAVEDVEAAFALVPEPHVVLGGDSAGGCLALLAALGGTTRPAGLALVSPVVDLTLASSRAWTGDDALVRSSWVEQGVAAMFGADRPDLLAADLSGLPPAVLHVAEHERLRPEGEVLAGRLGAELVTVPDGWHDIHLQAGLVREAATAVAQLGGAIRRFLPAPTAARR